MSFSRGPFFDPLGETEPGNTKYTILQFQPQRRAPKWLPGFFTRNPVTHPNTGETYLLKPDDDNPHLDAFMEKHLDEVAIRVVKVKSKYFPWQMRCAHVQSDERRCTHGCYFLEKGGEGARFKCKRGDCEGHVYCGKVKEDEDGVVCFGKKGSRMVCLERQSK